MRKKPGSKKGKAARGKPSKGSRPRPRGPRQAALPGTEQVRDQKLDQICEGIGDERDAKNKAEQEEKGLIQSALQRMQGKNIGTYRHAGVELARVPGAEKLRVRLTKETGDADDRDLKQPETGNEGGGADEAGGE